MTTFVIDGVYEQDVDVLVVSGAPFWNLPNPLNVPQGSFVNIRPYAVNAQGAELNVTGLSGGLTYNAELERIECTEESTASVTATFTINGEFDATTTVSAFEIGAWKLDEGYFVEAKMPMTLVHPRSDPEPHPFARHRKAYPGIEYRIPVSVQGGAYPFFYEIVEGPAGMLVGQTAFTQDYGIVTWTPDPSLDGQEFDVLIRVTDQEYTSVESSFKVRVTSSTNDFIFVDHTVEASGDGSLAAPFKTLGEILAAANTSHGGKAVYLRRNHVYPLKNPDINYRAIIRHDQKPATFLRYPGENPVVDFLSGVVELSGTEAVRSDFFWQVNMQNNPVDNYNHNLQSFYIPMLWHRCTWFESNFTRYRPNPLFTGGNNGFIFSTRATPNWRQHYTIWGCQVGDVYSRGWGPFYGHWSFVVEDCVFNYAGPTEQIFSHGAVGIDWKSASTHISVRRCVGINGNYKKGPIENYNGSEDPKLLEFCYNLLIVEPSFDTTINIKAFTNSSNSTYETAKMWTYRNTLIGGTMSENVVHESHFQNNVLFKDGDNYRVKGFTKPNTGVVHQFIATGDAADIVGTRAASSTYLDGEYKLKGTYRTQYLGTHGHEISAGE